MNESRLRARLLTILFRDGQAAKITNIIDLTRRSEGSLVMVLRALIALERAGLVDARRLRLTLSGLALAAAFAERSRSKTPESESGRSLVRATHAA